MRSPTVDSSARVLLVVLVLLLPGTAAGSDDVPVPADVRDAVFDIERARDGTNAALDALRAEARAAMDAASRDAEAAYRDAVSAALAEFHADAGEARDAYESALARAEASCGHAHRERSPAWAACMRASMQSEGDAARTAFEAAREDARASAADARRAYRDALDAAREEILATYRERVDLLRTDYEARVDAARAVVDSHGMTEADARRALWESGVVPAAGDALADPVEDAVDGEVPAARLAEACERLVSMNLDVYILDDPQVALTRERCTTISHEDADALARSDPATVTRDMYVTVCRALLDSDAATYEVAWLPNPLDREGCARFLGVDEAPEQPVEPEEPGEPEASEDPVDDVADLEPEVGL